MRIVLLDEDVVGADAITLREIHSELYSTSGEYDLLLKLYVPEGEDIEEVRCAVMGVFAPIVGIIGTTQAAEALKLIIGCGTSLDGRLLLLDGLAMEWRSVTLGRDPGCAVCAREPRPA